MFPLYSIEETAFINKLKQIIFVALLGFLLSLPASSHAQLIPPQSEAVESSGDIILLTLPATAALSTVLKKDRRGFLQFTKGFLTNLAITGGLKYAINKRRPFNGGG